jgi:hypothetical protein
MGRQHTEFDNPPAETDPQRVAALLAETREVSHSVTERVRRAIAATAADPAQYR